MKRIRVLAASCLTAAGIFALGPAPPALAQTLSLGGFIKAENIYDTRQVLNIREGQFHLYPLPGEANEQDNLLFAAFQTRLSLNATGTRALGADVTAMIEADFFGSTNDGISMFFLRHAFARMTWEDREVLFGQFWSPMFVPELVPGVIGLNTGAPFQPFARHPQITFTYRPDRLRWIGSISQQRDAFSEIGGAKLHQQAALPAAHTHLQWREQNQFVGAGATVKAIRPTLTSDRFTAGAVTAYGGIALPSVSVRGKLTYGSDLVDHMMLGGFVTDADGSFHPLDMLSAWAEIMTPGDVSFGIFAGYLTNLGASQEVTVVSTNTRAAHIDYMWRVAPRVWYSTGRMRFAFETEITSALHASGFDTNYRPNPIQTDDPTTNVRFHFATYYFF